MDNKKLARAREIEALMRDTQNNLNNLYDFIEANMDEIHKYSDFDSPEAPEADDEIHAVADDLACAAFALWETAKFFGYDLAKHF